MALTLEAEYSLKVVDGRSGEVTVVVKNDTQFPLADVRVRVTHEPGQAAGRLEILPSAEHGGYQVERLAPGETLVRRFAVEPVEVAVGATYTAHAEVEGRPVRADDDGNDLRPPRVEPLTKVVPIAIEIFARPELYLALGAVAYAQRALRERYAQLVKLGYETQKQRPTQLPSTASVDPIGDVLSQATFDWARDVASLGLRLLGGKGDKP